MLSKVVKWRTVLAAAPVPVIKYFTVYFGPRATKIVKLKVEE